MSSEWLAIDVGDAKTGLSNNSRDAALWQAAPLQTYSFKQDLC